MRYIFTNVKKTTGSNFKPMNPSYLLNEDATSQYYFSGVSAKDKNSNGWSRVTTESLTNRNKDSIWTNSTDNDAPCKGIRIKFACGGSAGGFIYPLCILVSNISKEELPGKDFVVVPVEGLSINGHIDPRNKEIGYLVLMGSNVPQKHFFIGLWKTLPIPL